MSLLELTVRNVKRNFRLYTIYLFSMIIGVIIHFTFSALMFNGDVLDTLSNRQNFQNGVMIASVVIFLFIIVFILYANSFFMRQRKKEFGMYLLLGLSERQITLMVFYETLFIGAISLVSGILLGGLLSKLFGMLLMNLMQYDEVISLSFPIQAIGSTVGLFLLLAVIISVQSLVMVRRVQLVELFHAKEKMEKPIKPSTILAILALILLVSAFFVISRGIESVMWQDHAMVSMLIVAIGMIGGTYLFFRQFAGWLLQAISRRKKYHEGNTVLWTSSLRFQIRGNTLNLTFISLFSAAIILLTCFVTINYEVQFEASGRNLPNDIAFESLDSATNGKIDSLIGDSAHTVKDHRTLVALSVDQTTEREVTFDNSDYYLPGLLVVAEKDYNDMVDYRGHDERLVDLQGKEAVSLSQGTDVENQYSAGNRPKIGVQTKATTTTEFELAERKDYALLGWSTDPLTSMDKKPALLVVSDQAYQDLRESTTQKSFEIYAIEDAKNAEALSKEVHAIVSQTQGAYYSSFADVYSVQVEGSSLLLFASGFLALIATFALASVIYFKQLREATEEQRQYAILGKLGVNNREIRSVIRKQLLFVFVPPLLLAVLHSWFIIKYTILDSVQDFPGLVNVVYGILGAFFLIYLLLYLSSANLYNKIVTQKTT